MMFVEFLVKCRAVIDKLLPRHLWGPKSIIIHKIEVNLNMKSELVCTILTQLKKNSWTLNIVICCSPLDLVRLFDFICLVFSKFKDFMVDTIIPV